LIVSHSEVEDGGDDVMVESAVGFDALEEDIRRLEAIAENTPQDHGGEPQRESAMAPFVSRLEELGREVALVLERGGAHESTPPGAIGATEELDEEEYDYDVGGAWLEPIIERELREGVGLEPPHALDLELPSNDSVWDDKELERISQAMNAHFGDVVVNSEAHAARKESDDEEDNP
jgi:hypothetical protein